MYYAETVYPLDVLSDKIVDKGILYLIIEITEGMQTFLSFMYVLQVFVLVSFYGILRNTMTIFFPQGIAQIAEALISIKRLQVCAVVLF